MNFGTRIDIMPTKANFVAIGAGLRRLSHNLRRWWSNLRETFEIGDSLPLMICEWVFEGLERSLYAVT
jgi:hypothetical protein